MNPWDIPWHQSAPPSGRSTSRTAALPPAGSTNSRILRALRYIAAAPLVLVVAALGYVVLTLELVLRLLADLTLRIMGPAFVAEPSQANRGSVLPEKAAGDGPAPRQLFVVGDQPPCKIIPFHAGLDMSASRHSSPGKSRDFTGGDAA